VRGTSASQVTFQVPEKVGLHGWAILAHAAHGALWASDYCRVFKPNSAISVRIFKKKILPEMSRTRLPKG